MIRLLYIALLGQILVSCINMNDPKSQADYIEQKDRFDKSIVKLFPDRLPNNMLRYGFSAPYNNIPGGLHLTTKYFSEKEYFEAKTKFLKQSKYYTKATDKCLFLVDEYEGMNQEKCKDFYPIPTLAIFERDFYTESKTKQSASEVIFIEFKPGDYIKDNKNHSRLDLPENWTHGYSTGVTTNDHERTIQVWLLVW
jgi:hypothetical protein